MKKQTLRISMIAIPMMVIYGLLGSGTSAMAQSDPGSQGPEESTELHRSCSNRTLHGDYGATVEGFVVGAGLSIRGVVMAHFDGKGNLTQVDHIVTNGMPPALEWTPGSGTYTVNPDCTGSAVIHTPSSFTGIINLHFVVDAEGKEIRQVVDENAVTAIARRVE
jgi:hypothetical protein